MRLPRFLIAGLLLCAAVLLLTALFAQAPYRSVGATAAAVFLPLWAAIAIVNAGIGVVSAGYRVSEESTVLVAIFGGPALVAGLAWWWTARRWDGGPLITTGRVPLILLAGLALWLAVVLLAGLLIPGLTAVAALRPGALVFVPIWVVLQVVNLLIGVLAAGSSLAGEAPLLLLDAAVPALVAGGSAFTAARVRPRTAAEN